ncbi:arylesterase [Astrobacterium formosum]|uniref:arylesterase n=1 Tax=Astrobacterium formosum TaxID=3069710 RepID=UPI003F502284
MAVQIVTKLIPLIVAGALAFSAATAATSPARTMSIVVLGDSLTAGYGLPADQAFPVQLQKALAAKGFAVNVINAGVSGDTSSGGLARLDWSISEGTDAVIVELGANDALRGISPAVTEKALDAILGRLTGRGIPVLLCGMLAPPNMGADYTSAFNAIYPTLAERHKVDLYAFFLDGVAAERSLNQADGLHPTAEGVAKIVERILPKVEDLIRRAQK